MLSLWDGDAARVLEDEKRWGTALLAVSFAVLLSTKHGCAADGSNSWERSRICRSPLDRPCRASLGLRSAC